MKKGKIVLTLLVSIIALFVFVGCTESSSLMNSLIQTSENFGTISYSYDSSENESINNVELTALSETEYFKMELSDEGPSDLVVFNEKRLELIAIHQDILSEIEAIRIIVDSIKTKAETIRDNDYILLEGDKDIVKGNIENLIEYRDGLQETRGQAYLRISNLQGSYTRENLPEILLVFDEVYNVLEYRLETLRLGIQELEKIDKILSDYMEI
jgi:hypothetical protein